MAMLVVPALVVMHGAIWGHGGEDHGEAARAPVAMPGGSASMLTTYAVTEFFELLLKYPPPEVGKDATLRFFLSDYATNRALDGAIELGFNPAGVRIVKAPVMTSPGIFDAVVSFPADTLYSVVATVRSGRRTDFMELKNIYTGSHAEHFLAEHGGGAVAPVASADGFPWWWIAAPALLALLITGVMIWSRKNRRRQAYAEESRVETMNETESKERGI